MMAASLLGVTGDATAVSGLITALGNRAVPVRIAAARALGRLGASIAVGYLVEVLEGDPDPEVREATAEALGELGECLGRVGVGKSAGLGARSARAKSRTSPPSYGPDSNYHGTFDGTFARKLPVASCAGAQIAHEKSNVRCTHLAKILL